MKRAPMPWTEAEHAKLARLAADGLSRREAGAELGRSRQSVARKAERLRISFPITDEKMARTGNRFREARAALAQIVARRRAESEHRA